MKHFTLSAAALVALALAVPAVAQTSEEEVGVPPPKQEGWIVPRTSWGDPDITGTWPLDLGRTTMQRQPRFGNRKLMTEEEYAEAVKVQDQGFGAADAEDRANKLGPGNWFEYGRTLRQTSLIVEPANGRVPEMTEAGKARAATMISSWTPNHKFDSIADFNALDRCITRGLTASMIPFPYNNGVRIFQSPGYVAINLELIHETRIIPIGDTPQLPDAIRPWLGSSRGHWEGDTLVIETTNFNGEVPMVIVGPTNQPVPTSTSMKVVEHLTPVGPDTLYYEAWVSDPEVLTAPFKMGFPWTRDESYQPFEYACHEGNTVLRAYIQTTSDRFSEWRKARGGTE